MNKQEILEEIGEVFSEHKEMKENIVNKTRYKNKIFKTLTEREKQVYNAITMGAKFKSADIAEFMGIKRNNVNTVLKNMYKKLDLPKEWRNSSGILWTHFNQEGEDELS